MKCDICDRELVSELELMTGICDKCDEADVIELNGESDFDERLYFERQMEDY